MKTLKGKKRSTMSGLALVETTIVLPILLFLMIACFEVGRMLFVYNSLNKLTRDGARYLSTIALDGTNNIDLSASTVARIKNFVIHGNDAGSGDSLLENLTANDISISNPSGHLITINIDYTFTPVFGSSLSDFGYGSGVNLNFPLRTEVTMRAIN
jgi:hypothetical protein